MPQSDNRWYHATFGTRNSWLPGDPRGFRSRDHKIHSSGDHKSPPPVGEHAGLYAYSKAISGQPLILPDTCRKGVCNKVVNTLLGNDLCVLAASVGGMHVHLLVELPIDRTAVKGLIGIAKKSASQSLGDLLPGRVWARDCGLKPIRDEEHHRNTFLYIPKHTEEGAYVWTFRDNPPP